MVQRGGRCAKARVLNLNATPHFACLSATWWNLAADIANWQTSPMSLQERLMAGPSAESSGMLKLHTLTAENLFRRDHANDATPMLLWPRLHFAKLT